MTEKETLIKLIEDAGYNTQASSTRVANYLLANGVRIPVRCKDCVHCFDGIYSTECENGEYTRTAALLTKTGGAATENGGKTMADVFIDYYYEPDLKDYATDDMPPCPKCGAKAFVSHDIVDGFDMGYSWLSTFLPRRRRTRNGL